MKTSPVSHTNASCPFISFSRAEVAARALHRSQMKTLWPRSFGRIAGWVAGALMAVALASGTVAQAQLVMRSATGVTAPPAAFSQAFSETYVFTYTINQSGLSAPYTSGVTDYETYVASNPIHTRINVPGSYGATDFAFNVPLNIDYDLGATYMVGKIAFWNYPFNVSSDIYTMDIYTSNDPSFTTAVMVGTFTPFSDGSGTTNVVQSLDVADSNARYVRLRVTNTFSNANGVGLSEIAFGTTAPAASPTPAPVSAASGSVVTAGGASTTTGLVDAAKYDALQRSAYIAPNGNLAFLGYLESGTGTVTLANCTTSLGNPLVSCPSTAGLLPGMPITGPNMPPNAVIQSVGPTSFTITPSAIGLGNSLTLTAGTLVDTSNFMGYWKHDGASVKLLARQGFNAPETGATAAKFNVMPLIPGISDSGHVTLYASLLQSGLSNPATTAANDTGLWSELGGTGFQILIREDDTIPGLAGSPKVDSLGWGCFATATTGASTGEAAFVVGMKGSSTDSALLRTSVVSSNTTQVGVIARQGQAAPGAGENFGDLNTTITRAARMDATGNVVFSAILQTSGRFGIWYQDQATKAVGKSIFTGDAAPGTTGATFQQIDLPQMGGGGTFAFRGVLNQDGDNASNSKNDGIWKATGTGAPTLLLRRGDGNQQRPGLFDARYTGAFRFQAIKAGNIYNGWLTNANHGAWLGWVDLGGNGISSFPTNLTFNNNNDTYGIYTDVSGSMRLLVAAGDTAPGYNGAKFFLIDHPVCGGVEQVAFIGTVVGSGVTAGTNDKGVWRTAPNGGTLALVMRTGDTISVNVNGTIGTKTIANVDIPGSGDADHIWETPVMDATGRLLIFATFTDGSSGQVLVP